MFAEPTNELPKQSFPGSRFIPLKATTQTLANSNRPKPKPWHVFVTQAKVARPEGRAALTTRGGP